MKILHIALQPFGRRISFLAHSAEESDIEPLKNITLLHLYHLLKPEAGNLTFLYDQPGEHIISPICVDYLP